MRPFECFSHTVALSELKSILIRIFKGKCENPDPNTFRYTSLGS